MERVGCGIRQSLARDVCFLERLYVDILVVLLMPKGYYSKYSPTLHMRVQPY